MTATEKFSQFSGPSAITNSDIVVGLRGGANYQFTGLGSGGFTWKFPTFPTVIQANTGYLPIGPVPFTIPINFPSGSTFRIGSQSTSPWTITLSGAQAVEYFGETPASIQINSTQEGDAIEILCIVTGILFVVLSTQGNPEFQ